MTAPVPRFCRRFFVCVAALAVPFLPLVIGLWPAAAHAVGEQNARLRGSVVEAGTNLPMPGARVELRSSDMIGGPRYVTTDEEGRFDFPLIPPGAYMVTVSYEGLKPTRRRLTLEVGQTEAVKIPLSAELQAEETTVIVEERRRLDSDRLSTGKVLTAEQQSKLATTRRYQDVVQQLPGVTGGSNPVMAGGSFRHNRYLVDGLDITDPVSNTFSANFNFDAIAQMDMLLLAVDAQYNSLGGVINLVTKRGSDRFTADASLYVNHQSLSAGGRAGSQLYEARLLDQSDPKPPNASYQANLNIGGPIIKQKLWFYLSTQYWYRLQSVVPGPPLNAQHPALDRHDFYVRLKLTWAPAPRHRIELSLNADPAWISNIRNLSPANGNSNSYTPESEFLQNQGGAFGILNYDWFIRDNLIFSVQTGLQLSTITNRPQNGDLLSSSHFDRASTITWNAADNATLSDDMRWRFQLDPTLTWVKKGWLGQHTFKAGAQIQYLKHYALVGTPGNSAYIDDTNQAMDGGVLVRDPTSTARPPGCNALQATSGGATPCYQVTFYEPPRAQVRTGYALGAFVQDTWRPTTWLTLVPGLRVDYGRAQNSRGEVVQNLLGFGPRIGVSFDLSRDGKTLLKLAYGRSNEVSTLRIALNADVGASQSTWQWDRATGRFDKFYSSQGGGNGYDLRGRCTDGTVTLACGNAALSLRPPHSDFFTASLERELLPNVAFAATYTFRLLSDLWEDVELNAYRTLDGGNYASFADARYGNIRAYRPTSAAFRRYNALDLVISAAPTRNWQVFVAYTLSYLDGTEDDQLSTFRDDPVRDLHFRGYLSDDHRHQLKLNGSYTWRGLSAGVNLAFLTGAPATRLYLQSLGYTGRYGWRGVDPNADPNDIRKWTELRSPDILDVSVRAQYDFHSLIHQHLSLIVDLFNAFDLATATNTGSNTTNQSGFEARNSIAYGAATNRQVPLRAQFGIRYQY